MDEDGVMGGWTMRGWRWSSESGGAGVWRLRETRQKWLVVMKDWLGLTTHRFVPHRPKEGDN